MVGFRWRSRLGGRRSTPSAARAELVPHVAEFSGLELDVLIHQVLLPQLAKAMQVIRVAVCCSVAVGGNPGNLICCLIIQNKSMEGSVKYRISKSSFG